MNSSLTELKEVRKFGIIGIVFFGLVALTALWRNWSGVLIVFSTLVTVAVFFAAFPRIMTPVYVRWIQIAKFIGVINTGILLTLTYYLVVTPVALLRRLFGGSPPLPARPDPGLATYWRERSEPAQPKSRFIKRY